jgi:ribosomal protein L16 Arg81 hydroxylase
MTEIDLKSAIKGRLPTFFPSQYDFGDFDMFDMVNLYRSHPIGKYKDLVNINDEKKRIDLKEISLRPSAPPALHQAHKDLAQFRPDGNVITSIAFIGLTSDSQSFGIHMDAMDVYYVQGVGQVTWSFWDITADIGDSTSAAANPEDGVMVEQRVLSPGDAVWVPRGVWHHVTITEPRVGFSFGNEGKTDPSTVNF